ncbi:MAG: hypothetical protein APF80_10255, partial [Alphaproteobacteria bacterium BRH_c36]
KPQRQRASGFGSMMLYFAVGLLVLIGAGLAVLFVAPPTQLIRDQLVAQVKSATGRDLEITGRTGLTFYPGLGFSMQGVSLSPPPGMQGPPFVRMKSLNVQVKLLPLLSRTVSVDQFVLDEPTFDVRVDNKGRKSWDFTALAGTGPVDVAQAAGGSLNDAAARPPASGGNVNLAALDKLELGDVRILKGKIRYTDATAAARENVDNINVTLALKSLGKPLTAIGDLRYRGDKVDFQAVLKSLKQIMGNNPADLEANVKSDKIDARYNGSLDVSGNLRLNGDVAMETQSVRHLARWLGVKLPPATGFGPLKIAARLKADGPVYQLAKVELEVDGANGTGNIKADTSGSRPDLSGNLSLSELDLNKYLPPAGAGNRQRAGGRAGNRSKDAGPANKRARNSAQRAPGSIEDLIGEPGPRVKGYSRRDGWSTEPIDVSPLEALNANFNLALGRLLYENIKVGRSRLNVALLNQSLTAKLDEMELYDGVGRGVLTLNAQPKTPVYGANFNLSGVSAQPLLTDAADIDWLAGKGQILLALTSAGATQQDIVSSLNGNTSFAFEDGAVVGVNVPKIVRAVQQGRFNDLKGAPNEQTDFTKLSGSFNIQNGVAVNKDLEMLSPLLRVTGDGQVMLPDRQVDYTLKPKLVASLSGQGGDRSASGLEIPVRVHGPFEKLSYTPDLNGVLKDPEQTTKAIRELGRQYGGEKAGKVLDDLLGGGDGGASADGNGKAKKLLDDLFGGR